MLSVWTPPPPSTSPIPHPRINLFNANSRRETSKFYWQVCAEVLRYCRLYNRRTVWCDMKCDGPPTSIIQLASTTSSSVWFYMCHKWVIIFLPLKIWRHFQRLNMGRNIYIHFRLKWFPRRMNQFHPEWFQLRSLSHWEKAFLFVDESKQCLPFRTKIESSFPWLIMTSEKKKTTNTSPPDTIKLYAHLNAHFQHVPVDVIETDDVLGLSIRVVDDGSPCFHPHPFACFA